MTLVKCDVGGVAIVWGDPGGLPAVPAGASVGVASDLYLGPGDDAAGARIVRRVAVAAEDLGFVFDPAGVRLGRVVSLEGDLLRWCVCPAAAGVDVVGGVAGGSE